MFTIKTELFRPSIIALFVCCLFGLNGQEIEDSRRDEILGLTKFYEYILNTLGSQNTSQRDKDIIVTESFTKAFDSKNVQVEDDLLNDRKVITNKDIHAYLRDVDFFFQEVSFKFDSIKISEEKKPNDEIYYLVSFEKTIDGTSLEGLPIKKVQKRFLEVNLDEENSNLKIVSVYTTKVSREEELKEWYASLSFGWINVFDQYFTYDSITDDVLQQMADIDSLDLSENTYLKNISPLVALKNLQYLNISNTSIEDISPIRYASSIKTIIANNTPIKDLSSLQYFDELSNLSLQKSVVTDLSPIKKLTSLNSLDISETTMNDLSPLASCSSLKSINLTKTNFHDLSLLKGMEQLVTLNIAQTKVTDLRPLASLMQLKELDVSETSLVDLHGLENHPSLEIIDISQTLVNSLESLANLKNLKKVEADLSNISSDKAIEFMAKNPNIVVVVNSEERRNWWESQKPKWKGIFKEIVGFDEPSKEDLIKLTTIDSLDISNYGESEVNLPLSQLNKLRYLNISGNPIKSFDFTKDMTNLEVLIADSTQAENASGLSSNTELSTISLKNSKIEDISALHSLRKLGYLDLDGSRVPRTQILDFITSNPKTTLIWRSEELQTWWRTMDNSWKRNFHLTNPTSEQLHQLTHSSKVELSGLDITQLGTLDIFLNIHELDLDQVGILSFRVLESHSSLSKLSCRNGPLNSMEGLDAIAQLKELDISNTAIEDLEELNKVTTIRKLNCSGTNIKRLKGLEEMKTLEYLNISNTNIFKLDRLENSDNLKELICFNTRLRKSEVEDFQKKFPDCEIIYY